MYKVILIDSDDVERKMLQDSLRKGFDVLGSYKSVHRNLNNLLSNQKVDLLLIDPPALSALRDLRTSFPELLIGVRAKATGGSHLIEAFIQGADGYFIKDYGSKELVNELKRFVAERAFISSSLIKVLIQHFAQEGIGWKKLMKLTNKDFELLMLLRDGRSYQESADELEISISGVRSRVVQLYKKLGATSKVKAIQKYNQFLSQVHLNK